MVFVSVGLRVFRWHRSPNGLELNVTFYSLSLLMLSEWFHFLDYTNNTHKDDSWQEARFNQYGFLIPALWYFWTEVNWNVQLLLSLNLTFFKPKKKTKNTQYLFTGNASQTSSKWFWGDKNLTETKMLSFLQHADTKLLQSITLLLITELNHSFKHNIYKTTSGSAGKKRDKWLAGNRCQMVTFLRERKIF